ncbi:hypothetical protein SO802_019104 [Lithocarpus litseifolius]|uniref:Uncharacterized protein n=1 Tax=Lithocarpus litseifolius TaxID=425828 RepID=A0AAW2CN83_9ROSI
MASYQVLNHSHHQVHDSCSTRVRHGYSKAQMCLNKILGIISSIPPPETPKESQDFETKGSENNNNRGVGIDLNLRLGPLVESEEEEESLAENGNNLSACSVVVGKVSAESTDSVAESAPAVHVDHVVAVVAEKSSESECDPKEKLAAEKAVEVSEITTQQRVEESSEIDDDEVVVVKTVAFKREENENKSSDCLGLLVEAARLISGDFEEDDESPSRHHQEKQLSSELGLGLEKSKRKRKRNSRKNSSGGTVEDWMEDTSPVVKSKRGRNQVLPTRYRDSVLEPWKPLPRPLKSSTTTAVSSRKPRSR